MLVWMIVLAMVLVGVQQVGWVALDRTAEFIASLAFGSGYAIGWQMRDFAPTTPAGRP